MTFHANCLLRICIFVGLSFELCKQQLLRQNRIHSRTLNTSKMSFMKRHANIQHSMMKCTILKIITFICFSCAPLNFVNGDIGYEI